MSNVLNSAIFKILFGLSLSVTASSSLALVNANPAAPFGGNVYKSLKAEPATLHPIKSSDLYASIIQGYVMDQMLIRNVNTFEWEPRVATKWEISKDNKVFTFHLRNDVVFHDGKPLTADDIKFSFDAIFEPKYQAENLRPYYEGIEKVEVVDPYTIKAYAKDNYFRNFDVIAGLTILPKHIYSDVEKSNKMNKELVGCGPYVLESYEKGQKIVLKKFDKWFAKNDEYSKGLFNFERITYRFVKDDNVQLEMLKKGELDVHDDLNPEQFELKATGPLWGTSVFKVKAENKSPKSYSFYGWNMRKDLFKDLNVRLGLAHLLNRDEMNKKFRFGFSYPVAGPLYVQSEYTSPAVKPILFNPQKAQELFKKAGWVDSDKNGILDKVINGQKVDFKFTLLHSNKDFEKYHTMYQEELKKAGVIMDVKYVDWSSFAKNLDEQNFDAVSLRWSAAVDWDPKQIWHSKSAVKGGSNFAGFMNPEVDKLIDEARVQPDRAKRLKMLRTVYEKIAEQAPYAFLFNDKFDFYAHTKRVQKPGDTMVYDIGSDFWWIQP